MRTALMRSANAALATAGGRTGPTTTCPRTGVMKAWSLSPPTARQPVVIQRRHDSSAAAFAPGAAASTVTATSTETRSQHAISNPTLAGIEKRWETMPPAEQAELWLALRKRMKVENWAEMTLQEKKAAYYVAFGAHGPRAESPRGEMWTVLGWSAVGVFVSFILFMGIRAFARPPPKTMTKEWEEKTNEYLKAQGSEPITGISSAGYTGKGYVQSPPERKQ